MIYISHRGNLFGRNIDTENTWKQIQKCLELNYHVEIDVWYIDGEFYLGHDRPMQPINLNLLINEKLWCHAKNYDALVEMKKNENIHCFWHEKDKYTLTSKGIVWAYPGEKINSQTVCVLPELCQYSNIELQKCYGICSDNIAEYVRSLDIFL